MFILNKAHSKQGAEEAEEHVELGLTEVNSAAGPASAVLQPSRPGQRGAGGQWRGGAQH